MPVYSFRVYIIIYVDKVMICFAARGIPLTLFTGDGTFVKRRSMVLSSHVGIFTTFSKFCRHYYDLISKFQVGFKSLLRHGLSEPEFYGDLVYKLKKIVGSNTF